MHAMLNGDPRAKETQHADTDTAGRLSPDKLSKRAKGEGLRDFNAGGWAETNSRAGLSGKPVGGNWSDVHDKYLHTRGVKSGYERGGKTKGIDAETLAKAYDAANKEKNNKEGLF